MPQYNEFFNNHKTKLFPLESLETIIKDPTKYNMTKKILAEELEKQQKNQEREKLLAKSKDLMGDIKKMKDLETDDKKIIGSKYKFVKTFDDYYTNDAVKKEDNDIDISLYLSDVKS